MNRSEQTNELDSALAKAQETMGAAAKDSNNTFFHSKYADLAACWDAWRSAGPPNGLSLQQFATARFERLDPPIVVQTDEKKPPKTIHFVQHIAIETHLCHSSGQWKSEVLEVLVKDDSPQATGLGITYARRFAMCAICGIAPEDDDGNAAANGNPDLGDRRPSSSPKASLPDCPQCGKKGTTIVGKPEFGGGLVCFKNGGCKHSWETPDNPFVGDKAKRRAPPPQKLSEALRAILVGMPCSTREESNAVLLMCIGKTLEEAEALSVKDSASAVDIMDGQFAERLATLRKDNPAATKKDAMYSILVEACEQQNIEVKK